MKIGRMLLEDPRFALRELLHETVDRVTKAPPRPLRLRDYVSRHATRNDPASVLAAMDRFATEVRFLMNVGPEKGPLLREITSRLPASARVLELGAYCGYSSIMMAMTLPAAATILSVEKSAVSVEVARDNIAFAGLADRIAIVQGNSSDVIPTLEGPFELVFIDHWKPLYLPDLQAIERHGLLRSGSIVVADNVGEVFGAEEFLDYVRSCGHYRCENRPATIEYSRVSDAVEIAVRR